MSDLILKGCATSSTLTVLYIEAPKPLLPKCSVRILLDCRASRAQVLLLAILETQQLIRKQTFNPHQRWLPREEPLVLGRCIAGVSVCGGGVKGFRVFRDLRSRVLGGVRFSFFFSPGFEGFQRLRALDFRPSRRKKDSDQHSMKISLPYLPVWRTRALRLSPQAVIMEFLVVGFVSRASDGSDV